MKLVLKQEHMKDRVLYLSGSAYEQGFTHGRLAAALIKKNLSQVEDWIEQNFDGDRAKLTTFYEKNRSYLEAERTELLEELSGIAKGSGCSLEQILLMNIQIYFTLKWISPECSQFCKVLNRGATGQLTLTGKNRDNSAGPKETVILMRTYQDGLKMIEVGFAGIITGPGNVLTNRKVSITSSGVWSPRLPVNSEEFGMAEVLPDTHRLAKSIVSCEEAERYLTSLKRACGMNYIVAVPGEMVLISLSAHDMKCRMELKSICATNHYPFEEWRELSYLENEYSSTHYRYRRITKLMENASTVKECWEILSDHKDFPQDSVCRHIKDGKGSQTTYGALSVVEEETMYVVIGNPCLIPSSQICDGETFIL